MMQNLNYELKKTTNEGISNNEMLPNNEELLAHKYSLIAEAFVNINHLKKTEFFEGVFNSIFTLIPEAQKGSFYELDGEVYKPVFCRGYDFDLIQHLVFNKDDAFIDFESSSSQIIDAYQVVIDKRDDSRFSEETIQVFKQLGTYENFASLYAPIKYDGLKIGIICLENFDVMNFSNNSKLLLKIYAQLISNVYSLRLHQERERAKFQDIINSLVSAIEIKDEYTKGHAKRVSEISMEIAKEMNMPDNRIEMIEIAATLHDIGKIGTPREYLTKESKLTDYEYKIVKRHTEDTKKILKNIQGFDEIVDFASMHHENYDGSGYPLGLCGEEIPIEAQIIQAADAFDAMTSNRSYRTAMSKDTVLNIFREQSGKQFSPEIAAIIIKLYLE
jgi:polar amino acid transport system substrate-binding protein